MGARRRILREYRRVGTRTTERSYKPRPPFYAKGRLAQRWYRQVNKDLVVTLRKLKANRSRLIEGDISLPKNMRFRSGAADESVVLPAGMVFLGGTVALHVLTIAEQAAVKADRSLWIPTLAGTALAAGAGALIFMNKRGRSNYRALQKILKEEKLHAVSKSGAKLTPAQKAHNGGVVERIEARLTALREQAKGAIQRPGRS